MPDFFLQIARILEKLVIVNQRNETTKHYGADPAWFDLNPCLSEQEIMAFEQEYQVILPGDYRLFLMQVGNGSKEDDNGFFSLEKGTPKPAEGSLKSPINQPFLLREGYDYDQRMGQFLEMPDLGSHWNIQGSERWVQGNQQLKNELTAFGISHGFLTLCNQGCAMFDVLIVTGPEAGTMWLEYEDGMLPQSDKRYNLPRLTFLNWYEQILDQTLYDIKTETRRYTPEGNLSGVDYEA